MYEAYGIDHRLAILKCPNLILPYASLANKEALCCSFVSSTLCTLSDAQRRLVNHSFPAEGFGLDGGLPERASAGVDCSWNKPNEGGGSCFSVLVAVTASFSKDAVDAGFLATEAPPNNDGGDRGVLQSEGA